MKDYENFSKNKCKSFGFTFSFVSFVLSIYYFFNSKYFFLIFLSLSSILILLSFTKPISLKFFAFYWERLGVYLGIFFSPIILSLVYLITIIPINLVIRLLNIDLLKKKKSLKKGTYWEINKRKDVNFRDQF